MRKIRLIFELCFIFVLPLLFILPNFSIKKEFVYDNDGNFQTSDLYIDYDLDNIYIYNKNSLIKYMNWNFANYNIYIDINSCIDIIDSQCAYLLNTYPNLSKVVCFVSEGLLDYNGVFINENDDLILLDSYEESIVLQKFINDYININNVEYYYYKNLSIELWTGITIYNYGYYIEQEIDSLTLFGQIKQLINNILHVDNVIIDIIIFYCFLWILMFIIWHLLYCILDFIVHLLRKYEYSERSD